MWRKRSEASIMLARILRRVNSPVEPDTATVATKSVECLSTPISLLISQPNPAQMIPRQERGKIRRIFEFSESTFW